MSLKFAAAAWKTATTCSASGKNRSFICSRQEKSNREIADLVHISISTVETHRNKKLHLHNLAELILYAVRKGLIS
jgi:DNA-binding CsgD family transcriptional regulator